jgi:hypothetical protein
MNRRPIVRISTLALSLEYAAGSYPGAAAVLIANGTIDRVRVVSHAVACGTLI